MARFGFTTGSCSAAAAKAAAYMLLTGKYKNQISIETPKGIMFDASILDIERTEDFVSCCVIKDGGDDPDITTGAHVYAKVSVKFKDESGDKSVEITGGEGIGIVTRPGLDQPVGSHAINSVPRKMIEKEVLEVMEVCDFNGTMQVLIYIPEGLELAEKTFNPRLGIVGGISVLGTSGIVEPMSSEAILATIEVELNQKKAMGISYIPVSPGNYGLEFMKKTYDFDLDKSVKSSNFIGETIDYAVSKGFKGMLFTGHIGKLVKVAGGYMNTHSKYGDHRMEIIADAAEKYNVSSDIILKIKDSAVTEDAVDILDESQQRSKIMDYLLDQILFHMRKRAGDNFLIECMMYSNKHGILAKSSGAENMLEIIREQANL